ncbi:hypothetical protein A2U01_0114124, partial [Trifolium medium]|nr:hypothetical protein [Trifolium medium]
RKLEGIASANSTQVRKRQTCQIKFWNPPDFWNPMESK